MKTNIEIKSIISMLFAQQSKTEDLKNLANTICAEVKEAYEARFKEIKDTPSAKTETPKTESKSKSDNKKPTAAKSKASEPAKPESKSKTSSEANDIVMETIDLKAIKKLGLTFEKYSDWCWVLRGETKPLRKILKEKFKGVFNSRLSGGEGWVIKTDNVKECAKALGLNVKVA